MRVSDMRLIAAELIRFQEGITDCSWPKAVVLRPPLIRGTGCLRGKLLRPLSEYKGERPEHNWAALTNVAMRLVTALFLFIASASASAQWQQSISPNVQLGIRSKNGESSYVAEFIVTGPDGSSKSVRQRVRADDFGYVTFPEDFGSYFSPGNYRWKARVAGKDVVGGQFTYARTAHGSQVTTVD
jgi:hypothetical protein